MTPSLPVALVILTFFGAPALAAPAPASPDFEPMLACSPDAHKYFGTVNKFAKEWPAERMAGKLEFLASGLNSATSRTDEAAWSLENKSSLPIGCRIGEPRVKAGVYAALSELRREIIEKAKPKLDDHQRSEAADLTEKERNLDALMGAESKSVSEFKAKLNALGIIGGSGTFITQNPTRADLLAIRVRDIRTRVREAEESGKGLPGANIPDAVRESDAKSIAKAKNLNGDSKGFSFGDKIDTMPSGPQTAEDRNEGGGRAAAATPITKKPRGPRAVETAEMHGDTDPDEPAAGGAANTVANSAMKPLGGAVNPPSAEEANKYAKIREEAKKSALRKAKPTIGAEDSFAELGEEDDRKFGVRSMSSSSGNGRIYYQDKSGKLSLLEVVNGKLVSQLPAGIPPDEAGAIDAEVEQINAKK